MKKVIAAAGLAVLSAASVRAQYAPGLTPIETSKFWSITTTARGFYDDNYLTLPKSYATGPGGTLTGHPLASWGTEVSPGAAVNFAEENWLFSASGLFDYEWYAQSGLSYYSYQIKDNFQYNWSDRYKLSLNWVGVLAQEPTVLGQDNSPLATPLRVNGDNIRYTEQADFTASLTKLFDLHLGYGNTIYQYQQVDKSVVGYPFTNTPAGANSSYTPTPSYAGLLDRMEQLTTVDLRWKATLETIGILGFTWGHTEYGDPLYFIDGGTKDPFIVYPDSRSASVGLGAGNGPYYLPYYTNGAPDKLGYHSSIRDNDSYTGFVGVDESFSQTINGSFRVGAEYLDYYKYHTSRVSPYVDLSVTDQYASRDSAQLGVKHLHNATDVAGFAGTTPVLDEESTVIYISDTHRLTDKLTLTALAQAQLSTFNGGGSTYNGREEDFYTLSINFAYRFTPWLSGETGYNYSKLNSSLLSRGYTRDVMYLGLRAVY